MTEKQRVYKRVLDMRDTVARMTESQMGDLSLSQCNRLLFILDAMDVFLKSAD